MNILCSKWPCPWRLREAERCVTQDTLSTWDSHWAGPDNVDLPSPVNRMQNFLILLVGRTCCLVAPKLLKHLLGKKDTYLLCFGEEVSWVLGPKVWIWWVKAERRSVYFQLPMTSSRSFSGPANKTYTILEKTLESPLDCKIKPGNPKGNQPWIFVGRIDAKAEAQICWPSDVKSRLTGKDPDAGKEWRQKQKGASEDEMVGWHHWLNGHEFEQMLGTSEGQGSLPCCSPWGCKESDMAERLNHKNKQ